MGYREGGRRKEEMKERKRNKAESVKDTQLEEVK